MFSGNEYSHLELHIKSLFTTLLSFYLSQHDVKDSLDSFLHFRTCVNFVCPIFIWIYSRPFSQQFSRFTVFINYIESRPTILVL